MRKRLRWEWKMKAHWQSAPGIGYRARRERMRARIQHHADHEIERRAPLSTVLVWIALGTGLGIFWRELFHALLALLAWKFH
jgi:hypothetical protein